MTISSTTVKNSYSGNGTLDTFNYTFKIFANTDLQVIIRDATATETVKTLTTHYTVTGAGSASGGTIVFTAGNIPTATETVVIRRAVPQTQAIDYIANDPFPAESHEEGLDRAMMTLQQLQEEVDRSIKLSRTNTMNSTEFTIGSTDRAGKIFGFDSNGELVVSQELGTFKGNWSASTTYNARDIVKDTSTNNIFLCNTGHTSSGSQPLTTNTDSAKWDLLVDAASATTSATNAAASATAAATSATNSATSATASATSATASANSATAAATSATSAANSFDSFDDRFLGTKASDPTLDNDGDALVEGAMYYNSTSNDIRFYNGTSWDEPATEAATSATNAASSATSAASSATTATTQASNASTSATNAATSETNAASSATAASTSASAASTSATNAASSATTATTQATNASTSATNAANSATAAQTAQAAAEAALDNFDDVYLGAKASDPSVDNDGDALTDGDLYFNTTANQLKYWDGSNWQGIGVNTDITTKVSANDTTTGFLNGKLIAGTGINLTENNDGGNETLSISAALTNPTISSISPDTITNAQTSITITGSNFVSVPQVEFLNPSTGIWYVADTVTFNNSTSLTVQATLTVDAQYKIRIENPDGLSVLSSTNILTVSDAPTWNTAAGDLGTIAGDFSGTVATVSATSDSAVTYSETTSVLTNASQANCSLNSSTGVITTTDFGGSSTTATTYNFTIRATDAEGQTADRSFSLTSSYGATGGGQFN
jgi:hypothetical protein